MQVLYTCGPAETRDSGATFLRHLAGEPPGDPDNYPLPPWARRPRRAPPRAIQGIPEPGYSDFTGLRVLTQFCCVRPTLTLFCCTIRLSHRT